MGNQKIPDAWDDDWEAAADRTAEDPAEGSAAPQAPKTKAERLAEHRELNRQIWQEAEAPADLPFHVATTSNVPFTQGFKPQMKLLSRKPMIKTKDPITGLEKLTLQDDGDDDDDADKEPQPTAEEIREQRQREREEKERNYDEARARIFGETPSGTPSGASTPRTTTPPLVEGGRGNYRGRGRGRGGRGGRAGQRTESYRSEPKNENQERRQVNNSGSPYRELFDPDAGARPGSRQQRGGNTSSPTRGPEAAIRSPRGPDNSGRGGFGFVRRGAKG